MRNSLAFVLLAALLVAQNCNGSSTGRPPLNDLGAGMWQGYQGGLYPAGSNTIPAAHLAAGMAAAAQVQPLNATGQPDLNGRIGLVNIGMSNNTAEWQQFMPLSNADPLRNGSVRVVDCAVGGATAALISNPNDNYWTQVAGRLLTAGVTHAQVQSVWLKTANAAPNTGFPAAALTLRDHFRTICQVLKQKFPNIKLCHISSRTYAGYATTVLNPEPYAHESGFSVKWVIEQQISGDPGLAHTGPAAVAPWIGWGPYLWADGINPRSDGLMWLCSEFQSDGTHPGPAGCAKVAGMLQTHYITHPTTASWYHGGIPAASVAYYGTGCSGTNGVPAGMNMGLPWLGNTGFGIGVQNARVGAQAWMFMSLAQASAALAPGVTLLIDPFAPNLILPGAGVPSVATVNSIGRATFFFSIPALPALGGLTVHTQWAIADPLGAFQNLLALSNGSTIRIGVH